MKKPGAKEICGAVAAVGIVACFLVYILVFNKYNEMTEALEASNKTLAAEVEDLKQYYDNMEMYQQSINEMKATIAEVTKDYPGDAREEDTIVMAVNMQETAPVNFDNVNIASTEVLHSVPEDTVKALGEEDLNSQIDFRGRQATYSYTTNYYNLKSIVGLVYDDEYRVGINSISASKNSDEDNVITGTIDITYYSLTGMNKEYKKPDMPEYMSGLADLFGIKVTEEEEE